MRTSCKHRFQGVARQQQTRAIFPLKQLQPFLLPTSQLKKKVLICNRKFYKTLIKSFESFQGETSNDFHCLSKAGCQGPGNRRQATFLKNCPH